MIKAGLTGGIATGKSTVARIFRNLGAKIIDADKIAKKAVEKGRPTWQKIVDYFGDHILLANGEIDRARLGKIIFNDPAKRKKLNSIVHPYVFSEMENEISKIEKQSPGAIVIRDIPLLLELGLEKKINPVILVYAPGKIQLERLMKRDNLSREDAVSRIKSQMDIEKKRELAHMIIDNSKSIENTEIQVIKAYNALMKTK